ncbi:hypothetical protein BVC80_1735g25 [Macleaya cordata]|uniref:F-box associated domain n=1 Tax=Macleaya cordata TaxID=56857 RepID=A0A200Q8Y5_MACCD|nr:hypothetical protein BVC80_1735g25 [Macleaya cordata]
MHVSSGSNYKEKAWIDLPTRELIDGDILYPVHRITNIDTSASIRLNGVTTIGNEGQVLVHYLLCFDTHKGTILMCTRLPLPPGVYPDVDLVECAGRVFVVVLMEEDDTATLCVWEFHHEKSEWKKIATMPPHISDDYYNSSVHITCAGHGDYIMVCLNVFWSNSTYYNNMMMYNIKKNSWIEVMSTTNLA